jgi:zinc protease
MRMLAAALALALMLPAATRSVAAATAVVDLGGSRAYVRSDPGLALCGITLFVRAGLERQGADQNGLAALAAESVLRQRTSAGVPVTDAVSALGGSLSYAVAAQYVRFYLEGPADSIDALAALVSRALAAPAFDTATLTAARTALDARIADDERDPRQVGMEMLRESHYVGGAGMPALGTTNSLAAFAPADVQAFFAKWYGRGDAFVTVVGRTGPASSTASAALVAALPAGTAARAAVVTARPYGAQPKRLVTRRDVFAPFVVIGFAAPSLGDPDFPTALVMRTLLAEVLERPSATTTPLLLRAGGTIYGYDTTPSQLTLWINGGMIDPTAGISAIDAVLKRAASQPLTAAAVTRFKERARGEWALENLSLDERAWEIGNAVAQGLDADAAAQVDAAIAGVTPADLQRVAQRYFQRFDVALVLPRAGSGG